MIKNTLLRSIENRLFSKSMEWLFIIWVWGGCYTESNIMYFVWGVSRTVPHILRALYQIGMTLAIWGRASDIIWSHDLTKMVFPSPNWPPHQFFNNVNFIIVFHLQILLYCIMLYINLIQKLAFVLLIFLSSFLIFIIYDRSCGDLSWVLLPLLT